jgi:cytochrome c biogenesis protein CcdA
MAQPTDRAKEILTDEVREAAGDEAAAEASERLDSGDAVGRPESPLRAAFASNRLFLVVGFALALTVGGIAALALGAWWALAVALLIHGVLSTVVIAMAMQMTTDVEKPAPEAEAELEEEGVADPEAALNELLGDETEDQQTAITPSSEETRTPGG